MRYSGSTSLRGLQKRLEVIHFSWSWFRIPKSLLLGFSGFSASFRKILTRCVCFILARSFEPLRGQTIDTRASQPQNGPMWKKNDTFRQECQRFFFRIFAQIFARVKMKTLFKNNFGLGDLKAFKPSNFPPAAPAQSCCLAC